MTSEHADRDVMVVQAVAAVPSILDVVCRTTGMGCAVVARVTEERWLACSVHDEAAFGLRPGGELAIERTFCRDIRSSGVPVIIDDAATDPVYCGHPLPKLYGFQSYISVPINLPDGRFFGTLCALDRRPIRVNTPETVGMFRLFAELIGFHLDAVERLERAEAGLLDAREQSRLREQFIAVLGHDLRNPLAAIAAGMRLLRRRPTEAKATELLGLVEGSVARMSRLIDNVLDFARGRLGGGFELARDPARPLEPLLRQVADELRSQAPDRAIETDFAIAAPVDCDPARIAQLFSNLLGNAVVHGAADQPIRVRAAMTAEGFELTVANGGPPIPAAARSRLFQPFVRGEAPAQQQGLGLGLHIAAEIARAHGGTLGVESDAAETRFTLRLPPVQDGRHGGGGAGGTVG